MSNPYSVVRQFEEALCQYTGASYAVTTTSCTMALLLACAYRRETSVVLHNKVRVPKRTYVGVPMSVIHAGFSVEYIDETWSGMYELDPLDVWDSARWFTSGMNVILREQSLQCVSFHWAKTLGIGQGGAILMRDSEAYEWLKRARFDGRTEGVPASEDIPQHIGWHAYMSPRDAAEGLSRLAVLPEHNDPIPNDGYPDLSEMQI